MKKAQLDKLIRRQSLLYLYCVFKGGLNKFHLEALQDPLILLRQHLIDLAGHGYFRQRCAISARTSVIKTTCYH